MEPKMLTDLELKVMQLLWESKKAFVKDLLEQWPDSPTPAYNTVSTIVRILEEKGFVDHESHGRSYQYFPLISKRKYQQNFLSNAIKSVFSGSTTGLISSLLEDKALSEQELQALQDMLDQKSPD